MGKPAIVGEEWKHNLAASLDVALRHYAYHSGLSKEHIDKTPKRYIEALEEIFNGCYKKPEDALSTLFNSKFDQMIHVESIEFFSLCAHHLLPFNGVAHFAYIPDKKIVGLSKIPRLVDVYANRPQIQEEMSDQIVDSFQRIVKPHGCGVFVRAQHFCCSARGVKKSCFMKTTSLRGCFKKPEVKSEFLQAVDRSHQ